MAHAGRSGPKPETRSTGPFSGVFCIGPASVRPLERILENAILQKRLDGALGGGMMQSMKPIESIQSIKSNLLGTGKVHPQGPPRFYGASLTPVPAFLKGQHNETHRTHTYH